MILNSREGSTSYGLDCSGEILILNSRERGIDFLWARSFTRHQLYSCAGPPKYTPLTVSEFITLEVQITEILTFRDPCSCAINRHVSANSNCLSGLQLEFSFYLTVDFNLQGTSLCVYSHLIPLHIFEYAIDPGGDVVAVAVVDAV